MGAVALFFLLHFVSFGGCGDPLGEGIGESDSVNGSKGPDVDGRVEDVDLGCFSAVC